MTTRPPSSIRRPIPNSTSSRDERLPKHARKTNPKEVHSWAVGIHSKSARGLMGGQSIPVQGGQTADDAADCQILDKKLASKDRQALLAAFQLLRTLIALSSSTNPERSSGLPYFHPST